MKQKNPARKNDIVNITITDINNLGCGVGRVDGVVTFVAGACTGDELIVRIIKVASDYNVGKIEQIVKASPFRIDPECTAAKRCGGCVYRYVTYEHELEIKQKRVAAAMKKAGLSCEVGEVLHTGEIAGYRNKAQYPIGTVRYGKGKTAVTSTAIGFYAEKSHDIIPCVSEDGSCKLQPSIFGEIADFVRVWMDENKLTAYDELTGKGIMRHLYLRRSETTGEVMVCFVASEKSAKVEAMSRAVCERFCEVASIYENINSRNTNVVLGREYRLLFGKEKLTDKLCGRTYEISPQSFWQVNRKAAELLYNKAAELADIKAGERVLDLFCGIGTVGMSVCTPDVKLYGIEIVPEAVKNAERNAELNGFDDSEFVCADASDPADFDAHLAGIAKDGLDAVILDPPRKGCAPELLRRICEIAPKRIVYISCNPDTLARDIALIDGAYTCEKVTPVDMFPRTGHVETVCLLSKLNAKQHIEINLDMDELDLTDAEKKATYQEIKDYVLEHSGLKVSSLYIAQVKQKCGIIERENYNKPKSEDAKQPQCPPDKEKAIKEALKHFGMI